MTTLAMTTLLTSIRTRRRLLLAACALAVAAPASQVQAGAPGWTGKRVHGNGKIRQEVRELGPFSGVSLSLPARVELRLGDSERVSIETDDNLLPLVETIIENGTLKLRPASRNMNMQASSMKIVVHAKQIERVALGGAGSISADALRAPRLDLNVGGSGSILVRSIECDSLTVTIGGSGSLKSGGGSAGRLSLTIGGSGEVLLGELKTGDASVNVAGSGDATLWVRDRLSATIAGSGNINYYGDPKVSKAVVGSGNARHLGAAPR